MASPFTYDILVSPKTTKGSIAWWVNHSEIDADQILTEAQALIYERLRAREMQILTTLDSIVADDISVALPDGFLDPIELRFDGYSQELEYVHENLLGRTYNQDGTIDGGTPTKWSIFDEAIQFDVPVDSTVLPWTGRLLYYGTPTALSSDNPTNFLTSRFPTLLRRACIYFGYEARNRADMMGAELKLVEDAIEKANIAADHSRRGQTLRR